MSITSKIVSGTVAGFAGLAMLAGPAAGAAEAAPVAPTMITVPILLRPPISPCRPIFIPGPVLASSYLIRCPIIY